MPTRVDGDLFEAAKSAGAVTTRSAAPQINHWARIGRELEGSPGTSQRDVQRVLTGDAVYDDLDERSQAIVRAVWGEQTAERPARLDLAAELTRTGRSRTDADEQGCAVLRGGDAAVSRADTSHEDVSRADTSRLHA